ncbi:MAG: alpha/beta hydrolase [Flavobacteriales bacterium]|jgi:pimeloyl-ACP methyl ester carboxylesterase|nr:alpha/beta hydrolase [Flavobacteriales bacterium]
MKSKKVKKNPSRITKSVIFFGQFLQFLAIPLAGKFVIRLFQSPIQHQMPEREQMMYKSATKERLKIEAINKEIQVYKYGFSKRKILILHGWAGRGTQLFTIADKLLENRFMVISVDGPAHGHSDGTRTNMTEFRETVKVLQEKYGPFEAAIGHSFGGMVLLKSADSFLKINKLVVMGTANDVREIIHDLSRKLKLKSATAEYVLRKLEKQYNTPLETSTSVSSAKNIDIPTLVIHDTDDKDVPVRCAYQIRQNLSKGSLLITHGLGHQRILKDPSIQNHIIEFLTK